jgi:hypothetical protein
VSSRRYRVEISGEAKRDVAEQLGPLPGALAAQDIEPEGVMRKRSLIAVTLMIVAVGLAACAGMSDEERCKRDGGVWKSKACEMPAK